MLTDAELILLVLAGFYVLEATYWVKPGAGVWVSAVGLRHRYKTAFRAALVSNPHGGLIFGNFLPFGSSTCCEPWPFSVSPKGILAFTPLQLDYEPIPHSRRFVPFSRFERATTDGRRLSVNGEYFLTAASQSLAKRYRQLFLKWHAAPETERASLIGDDLRARFDAAAAEGAYRRALQTTSPLRNLCILAMLFAFGLIPALLYIPIAVDWIRLLCFYAGLQILIAFFSFSAHFALFRERWVDRLKYLFTVAVSPADAMHACDTLLREALEDWHPLALAKVLGTPTELEHLAARFLRDARHPMPNDFRPENPDAAETVEWFRERYTGHLLGFDGRQEWIPLPDNESARTYCPRCLAQSNVEPCECTMCNLPSVRFPAPRGEQGDTDGKAIRWAGMR